MLDGFADEVAARRADRRAGERLIAASMQRTADRGASRRAEEGVLAGGFAAAKGERHEEQK